MPAQEYAEMQVSDHWGARLHQSAVFLLKLPSKHQYPTPQLVPRLSLGTMLGRLCLLCGSQAQDRSKEN